MKKIFIFLVCFACMFAISCEEDATEDPDPISNNGNDDSKDDDSKDDDSKDDDSKDDDSKDDDSKDDDSKDDSKKDNPELVKFYESLLGVKVIYNAEDFEKMLSLIPTGIYVFDDIDDDDDELNDVIAKGSDGSIFITTNKDMNSKSKFIGSSLYVDTYAVNGESSSFWLYNDCYPNEDPAPSHHEFEYKSREALLANGGADNSILSRIYEQLFKYFFHTDGLLGKYTTNAYKLLSEETELHGVACTHYSVKILDKSAYVLLLNNSVEIPDIIQEFWLTETGACIQKSEWSAGFGTSGFTLVDYNETGDFKNTYSNLCEKYNVYGRVDFDKTLRSHKVYDNVWLDDEYPDILNAYLIKYENEKTSFEVNRRAWPQANCVTSVIIEANTASYDEALEYVAKVKDLNLCTVTDDAAVNTSLLTMIKYEASNWDCTPEAEFGETVCYPAYEITYQELLGKSFTISFDWARVTTVK
ncbi:MAG: hypothetical protein MJ211_08390 [Bacteroidales bacterium]|nr:hypothetical protein [Bacteroidales bacterium]